MAADGSNVAFKAADLIPVDLASLGFTGLDEFSGNVYIESGQGIYYQDLDALTGPVTIVKSGDDGGLLDPTAAGLPITGVALERDGLRFGKLAFSASMAVPPESADESLVVDTWAGIYSVILDHDFNIVTGAGTGGGPHVWVFSSANGTVKNEFYAYDPTFTGGVRVAQGHLDQDGILDWITAAGAGGGPHVRVFSGASGEEIRSFYAYDPLFAGGVTVAASDFVGDQLVEIVTGPGLGGTPHVKTFSGATGEEMLSFYAYDPSFGGGVFGG